MKRTAEMFDKLPQLQLELVSYLEFNVPFQYKYGYIRDDASICRIVAEIKTVKPNDAAKSTENGSNVEIK